MSDDIIRDALPDEDGVYLVKIRRSDVIKIMKYFGCGNYVA